MSDGLNRVILLGNIGADPDLRYSPAGLPVLTMRVATNESYVDRNKEVQQRTDWHSVVLFGSRAEALARVLGKGSCVLVEGGLRTTSYEKDGVKRFKTEVHAREICITNRRPVSGQHDEEAMSRSPASMHEGAQDSGSPAPGEPMSGSAPEVKAAPSRVARSAGASAPASGRGFVDELPF